jgi:hypothetical protein
MGTLLHFPSALPRKSQDELVCLADHALAEAERALYEARLWLPRTRGAGYARALADIEELEAKVVELERQRLRIAGAEFCVLKGGL